MTSRIQASAHCAKGKVLCVVVYNQFTDAIMTSRVLKSDETAEVYVYDDLDCVSFEFDLNTVQVEELQEDHYRVNSSETDCYYFLRVLFEADRDFREAMVDLGVEGSKFFYSNHLTKAEADCIMRYVDNYKR